MKNRGDIAVRVDANSEIGLGHLRRCVTLIRQLKQDGFTVRLIGRFRFIKEIQSLIEDISVFWLEDNPTLQWDEFGNEVADAKASLAIIGPPPIKPSWVIVDHYGLGEQWERIIREAGHRVLVIDDFRNRRHVADILVSDTNARFDPALNGCPGMARELVGAQFALVDPEFAYSEELSSSVEKKKRVLVSYGGSDPTDETSKALKAVRLLRHNWKGQVLVGKVDVVVGQANARAEDIIRLANGIENVVVHIAPKSLEPLIRNTDLFLTAGGNSMVEGLTMRKPCLVTLTSDNQALMVAQLLEQRAIHLVGDHAMIGPLDVAKTVSEIIFDYEQIALGLRARSIFDQFGARRISVAIQSFPPDKDSITKYPRIGVVN